MDVIPKKKQKTNTPITTLPHEIIENILSRIPIKYLYRFKSVSKKWNSTISDPTFARIHLQESKKNSNLVAWEERKDFQGLLITKIDNKKIRFVSVIEYPWEEHFVRSMYDIECYCDGLYLKPCYNYYEKIERYILWNPSTRTYKKLSCPYPVDHDIVVLYGICYDPLTKDYKVVIADTKHYAVFSCRSNEWGEVKEMEDYKWGENGSILSCKSGISLNGSYYWMITQTIHIDEVDEFEIVCFDCKDEKLRKVAKPRLEVVLEVDDMFDLVLVAGHLCLLLVVSRGLDYWYEMIIMRKDEDEDVWMEFKVVDPLPNSCPKILGCLCSTNENKIIFEVDSDLKCLLYDQRSDFFVEIEKNEHRNAPFLYLENLFLL